MRSFGMIPVLPAFAGHVPRALERSEIKPIHLKIRKSMHSCRAGFFLMLVTLI